eukprot:Gregarina_sp_Poly_1__620@NODE_1147_length_4945_cov_9_941369_g791_i0_p2_GENE_NODE_1147_length_4945_cov_9_941369_g791_i0NODE_1147_length_4945_cov_9_941369_g791_i0_p2_ORF_typecomplete_len152_score14_50_NODE_1147_length_4945_cov_9_941369_g791_i030743529
MISEMRILNSYVLVSLERCPFDFREPLRSPSIVRTKRSCIRRSRFRKPKSFQELNSPKKQSNLILSDPWFQELKSPDSDSFRWTMWRVLQNYFECREGGEAEECERLRNLYENGGTFMVLRKYVADDWRPLCLVISTSFLVSLESTAEVTN